MILFNIIVMYFRGSPSWLLVWMPLFWIGIYLYKYLHKNSINVSRFLLYILICFFYFLIINEFYMAVFLLLNVSLFSIFYKYHIKNKYIAFMGLISYSFYLLHTIVAYPLLYLMTKYVSADFLFLKVLIVFIINIVIAYLSFNYIEKLYWNKGIK